MRIFLVAACSLVLFGCGSGPFFGGTADNIASTFFERAQNGADAKELCDLASKAAAAYLDEGDTKNYEDFNRRKDTQCKQSERIEKMFGNLEESVRDLN